MFISYNTYCFISLQSLNNFYFVIFVVFMGYLILFIQYKQFFVYKNCTQQVTHILKSNLVTHPLAVCTLSLTISVIMCCQHLLCDPVRQLVTILAHNISKHLINTDIQLLQLKTAHQHAMHAQRDINSPSLSVHPSVLCLSECTYHTFFMLW